MRSPARPGSPCKSAADRAIALGAHAQAVEFLDQAIGVTRDEKDQAELRLAAARSAESAVQIDDSDRYYTEVATWARSNDDWSMLATAETGHGRLLVNRSHVEPAIALLSATIDELRERIGDRELGQLYGQLARAQSLHDEPAAALAAADLGLAHAGRAHDAEVIADTLISKATALAGLGRVVEAVALLRGAIDLAERQRLRPDRPARPEQPGRVRRRERPSRGARDAARSASSAPGGSGEARLGGCPARSSMPSDRSGSANGISSWPTSSEAEEEPSEVRARRPARRSCAPGSRPHEGTSREHRRDRRRARQIEGSRVRRPCLHPSYSPAWIALCEGRFDEAYAGALAAAASHGRSSRKCAVVGGVAAALARDMPTPSTRSPSCSRTAAVAVAPFRCAPAELEACRLAIERSNPGGWARLLDVGRDDPAGSATASSSPSARSFEPR